MTSSTPTAASGVKNPQSHVAAARRRRPSLQVVDVVASPGLGGFFFDDQAAIRAGARRDGYNYLGTAVTPGYSAVREPSEAASIMLILDDGFVAVGDCASVQYSGVGGREPRLFAAELASRIEVELASQLRGLEVSSFRAACERVEVMIEDLRLGGAASYGMSQALLQAASHAAGHHLMGRVIKDEWELPGPLSPVPLYAQTGEDRRNGVDKMILKQVPVLPHGLINTPSLVGPNGDALTEYVHFIRDRIASLVRDTNYDPIIHLDVYGMVGAQAGGSTTKTADILMRLEEAAKPHVLRVEHPIDAGGRDAQVAAFASLRTVLAQRGSAVQIVADEWANTLEDIAAFVTAQAVDHVQIKTPDLGSIHNIVEAVAICNSGQVGQFIGGTCSETDISARATTHIGIATGATQMLAKPGMGVDEGLMIVKNEMTRAVRLDERLLAARAAQPQSGQPSGRPPGDETS